MGKMTKLSVLAMGAVMTMVSCQREEPVVETPEKTGVSTVSVTVGAGINQTKTAVVTEGGKRTLTFTAGDRLYVRGEITDTDPQKIVAGYLDIKGTPEEGATEAEFSGTLGVYEFESAGTPDVYTSSSYDFGENDPLSQCSNILGWLVHNGAVGFMVDAGQNGAYTTTIAATVNDLMTQSLPVYGFYDEGSFPLSVGGSPSTCTPIFNVNLSGLTPAAEYTLVYRNGGDVFNIDETKTLGAITADGSGNAAFACYISGATTVSKYHGFLLTNTSDGSDVKITSLATKALVSKVYNATREVYPASVTLNTVTQTDANSVKYYTARDGQTLTGCFSGYGYITIADGATVTLNLSPNSARSYFSASDKSDHAPIHCLGDAHIILAADSYNCVLAGSGSNYPAVFVPEGKTLTISGTGELVADAKNSSGAGIGGGNGIKCGNIVIAGGVIKTYSGGHSAGIGSGTDSSCGNITISGGAIKETSYNIGPGEHYGAGIGSGAGGSCGTITISGGQIGGKIGNDTYDGAIADHAASIGCGSGGSCGTITIGPGITCVIVSGSFSHGYHNLIGAYYVNDTPCDIYFWDFKVFDQTEKEWYQGSSEYYSDWLDNGIYGGIEFSNNGEKWEMTPAEQ